MLACWMSMALVACSSAADRALCTGEKTSSTPLVRLGSNIMLRLRTLTFSQPGYRLEMLTDTEDEKKMLFIADSKRKVLFYKCSFLILYTFFYT